MITKQSKWMIAVSVFVLLAMSAGPAFAMRPESEWDARGWTAGPVVVLQAPATPAPAEDRSGLVEVVKPKVEKPESEKIEVEKPESEKSEPAQPGASVEVTVPAQAPALQSEPAAGEKVEIEHGPEVEFKGTIESMSGVSPLLTLVVSGRIVTTTAQTVFLDPISVGAFVEVDGFLQSDQSVWAKKIKLDDNPLVELEVEFRGAITTLPNDPNWLGVWGVGQYTVLADASTQIDTRRGQPAIGAIAEVKAERQPDNSLLAVRIKIEDEGEFKNEIEFKGTISNLTGAGPYSMLVAGHLVTTNGSTVLVGTLANGAFVEVHGTRQPDNSVLATRIQVEDPINDELEFVAHIAALPANFSGIWTFDNGQNVTADANTLIDQSRGAAQVGALAQVKAVKQSDGAWLAVRIQIEDN